MTHTPERKSKVRGDAEETTTERNSELRDNQSTHRCSRDDEKETVTERKNSWIDHLHKKVKNTAQ